MDNKKEEPLSHALDKTKEEPLSSSKPGNLVDGVRQRILKKAKSTPKKKIGNSKVTDVENGDGSYPKGEPMDKDFFQDIHGSSIPDIDGTEDDQFNFQSWHDESFDSQWLDE